MGCRAGVRRQYQGLYRENLTGNELEAITNLTLSNALRQLASLLAISKEIFTDLNEELQRVGERSLRIKQKITVICEKVEGFDPKLVAVRKCFFVNIIYGKG